MTDPFETKYPSPKYIKVILPIKKCIECGIILGKQRTIFCSRVCLDKDRRKSVEPLQIIKKKGKQTI